jgi:hypothetical protein
MWADWTETGRLLQRAARPPLLRDRAVLARAAARRHVPHQIRQAPVIRKVWPEPTF